MLLLGAGLTKELLDTYGMPLEMALGLLRQHLPRNAVLVGQNIGQDVSWLGLKEGVDFGSLIGEKPRPPQAPRLAAVDRSARSRGTAVRTKRALDTLRTILRVLT